MDMYEHKLEYNLKKDEDGVLYVDFKGNDLQLEHRFMVMELASLLLINVLRTKENSKLTPEFCDEIKKSTLLLLNLKNKLSIMLDDMDGLLDELNNIDND